MPRMEIATLADAPEPEEGSTLAWVVDIPMGKLTYRYELLVDGTARIYKSPTAPQFSYTVKDGICSCPAAYHSKACKHIKPLVGFQVARPEPADEG